ATLSKVVPLIWHVPGLSLSLNICWNEESQLKPVIVPLFVTSCTCTPATRTSSDSSSRFICAELKSFSPSSLFLIPNHLYSGTCGGSRHPYTSLVPPALPPAELGLSSALAGVIQGHRN